MKVLAREGMNTRLEASVNGARRCAVSVWVRENGEERLVTVEDVNLSNSRDRSLLAAAVEPAYRDEVKALTLEFANEVVAHQLEEKARELPKEKAPFHPVEPWEETVDGAALLDALTTLLERYMVLPAHTSVPIVLWTLHTYAIGAADFTAYLHVSSPTRECGKSTLLELLLHTANRAQLSSGITAAALYRKVEKWAPTMLLDELDTRLKGENAEGFRAVLNSGFARTGVSTICVGKEHEVRDFKTFCPKVLAGIGRLPDTITSRSIPVRLARASKEEVRRLKKIQGHRIVDVCEPYRRQALRWSLDNVESLRELEPEVPEALGARQADVWRPLLAIADTVGGEWPDRARAAALALHGIQEEESDYGLLMLSDVRALFSEFGDDKLHVARIAEELGKRVDRPWSEYRYDKPISPAGVTKLLGRFDLKASPIRVGMEVKRGYKLEDLAPVFRRYLPSVQQEDVDPEHRGEAWEAPA